MSNEQNSVERLNGAEDLHNFPDHLARYRFAVQWAPGSDVLDVGCGAGYGSRILAVGGANKVLGIDVSEEALALAGKLGHLDNLTFMQADGETLPTSWQRFDLITCFEVLEHVTFPEKVISQIKGRLDKDGIALLSTPNADAFAGGHSGNPFHPSEMTSQAFKELVGRFFGQISWYGQFDNAGIWNRPNWQRSLIRLVGKRKKSATSAPVPQTSQSPQKRINIGIDDWYPVPWDTAMSLMYNPPPPLILAVCQKPLP